MAPDADAGKSAKRADPFAPLTSEQLAVSDGHDIYVESVGRAGGIAAVYLHGGPGSGCQPDHRRLFDPERFHAVLFDQRGAGRSRPKGRREANTLPHLIAETLVLLDRIVQLGKPVRELHRPDIQLEPLRDRGIARRRL